MNPIEELPEHHPYMTGWTEAAARSGANADLIRLKELFDAARDLAAAWLAAHPVGCQCPFCSRTDCRPSIGIGQTLRSVAGVHWAAEQAAADLESAVLPVPRRKTTNPRGRSANRKPR